MILWLIGMMGSGKSSAGRLAAERIGVRFSDSDEMIVEREGRSVAEIWEASGEPAFREMEKEVVRKLAAGDGICSTGGGVALDEENRRVMRESGQVIWLDASVETLVGRLGRSSDRPALLPSGVSTEPVLREMIAARRACYEESADVRLATDGLSVEATAMRIEALWRS